MRRRVHVVGTLRVSLGTTGCKGEDKNKDDVEASNKQEGTDDIGNRVIERGNNRASELQEGQALIKVSSSCHQVVPSTGIIMGGA